MLKAIEPDPINTRIRVKKPVEPDPIYTILIERAGIIKHGSDAYISCSDTITMFTRIFAGLNYEP